MQLAEAVGQVFEGEGSILNVDAALQAGIHQRTVRLDMESGLSVGGQVRVQRLCYFQTDRPAGSKIQLMAALERDASLGMQVGLFADDMQGIKVDDGIGERGVDFALAFQMNAGNIGFHLVEARFAAQLFRTRQRSVEGDRTRQRRLSSQPVDMGYFEERVDVQVREIEFGMVAKSPPSAVWPWAESWAVSSRVFIS